MKGRIWELDALRGIMIWGIVAVHLLFDLDYFYGIDVVKNPGLQYCLDKCGFLFVILSGISATLGRHPLRRGMQVFGCGMLITAVTAGMVLLGMADKDLIIYFGVLHLLGVCMLLWQLLQKLPTRALAVFGAAAVALGHWFYTFTVETSWLFPLGLTTGSFASGDYFPVFPHLGWFCLGAVLGRVIYKDKQSIFPRWTPTDPISRFFQFCGRHSIWIYLAHQPIVYGILVLTLGT